MVSHLAAGTAPPAGMHCDRASSACSVRGTWNEAHSGAALLCSQTSRRLHVLRLALQRPSFAGERQAHPAASPSPSAHGSGLSQPCLDRRHMLVVSVSGGAMLWLPTPAFADAQPGLVEYRSEREGYRIQRPSEWEQTGKAGADVLFVDPERKSTTVGVTVSPVRIASLAQFGDVAAVGQRLLGAERAKESTKSVEMLSEAERSGQGSGVAIYDFLYELDSTRGRKRILSSVAVAKNKLYIVNGNYKCEGSGCDASAEAAVEAMRRMAATFDVL